MSLECNDYVYTMPLNMQLLLLFMCMLVERSPCTQCCNKGILACQNPLACKVTLLVFSISDSLYINYFLLTISIYS